MIKGFERYTGHLTDYEHKIVLPRLLKILRKRISKSCPLTNYQIRLQLSEYDMKIGSERLRQLIHHIRVHEMVKGLIATSEGYYKTRDRHLLNSYIKSLQGRIRAIMAIKKVFVKELQLIVSKQPKPRKHEKKRHTG